MEASETWFIMHLIDIYHLWRFCLDHYGTKEVILVNINGIKFVDKFFLVQAFISQLQNGQKFHSKSWCTVIYLLRLYNINAAAFEARLFDILDYKSLISLAYRKVVSLWAAADEKIVFAHL